MIFHLNFSFSRMNRFLYCTKPEFIKTAEKHLLIIKRCTQTCKKVPYPAPLLFGGLRTGALLLCRRNYFSERWSLSAMQSFSQSTLRSFCRWYLACGNVREAALHAGCQPEQAEDEGLRMLQKPACRAYLAQLAAQTPTPIQNLVIAGLSRLAFGSVNDVAKLVFSESPMKPEQLEQLDLFHIISIKHDKGGVEIKLADRQHAMEKLLEFAYASDSSAAASALLAALSGPESCEEVNLSETKDCLPDAVLP